MCSRKAHVVRQQLTIPLHLRSVPSGIGCRSALLRSSVRPVLRAHGRQFPLMPKRTDVHSVLVIASGPIVISQACEFDYSGTQACRVLRNESIRVVLVNSNPTTTQTEPDIADAT